MGKPRDKYYQNLFREVIRWRSLGLKEDEARSLCLSKGKSILGSHFNSQAVLQTFEKAWTSPRKDFRLSDVGNAKRLVYQHGRDLRYCYPWRSWLIWRGNRWEIDDSGGIDRRAQRTVRSIYAEASLINDGNVRKAVADWAKQCESRGRLNAMIDVARSRSSIPVKPEDLDADPWLLNCNNGTLDLRTNTLLPHDRANLITKIIPIDYDPNAKCDLWLQFLRRIMREELIGFIQRAIGYALTGDTREQCLFILHGRGANGKSTLLETIRKVLGDYGKQSDFDSFVHKRFGKAIRNDIARLKGARFVSAVEGERGDRLAAGLVKQVTGQDMLQARFLFQEFFEFTPHFKIFLAVNHKPHIHGSDYAIWRRIHLIPYRVRIPESKQDKELSKKLENELPGILSWAVDGCYRWKRKGLDAPVVVRNAVNRYREEMDQIGRFIKECCEVSPNFVEKAADLYEVYKLWCDENGEVSESKKGFGLELNRREFQTFRTSSDRYRRGLRLIEKGAGEQKEKKTPLLSEGRRLPRRNVIEMPPPERRLPRRDRPVEMPH